MGKWRGNATPWKYVSIYFIFRWHFKIMLTPRRNKVIEVSFYTNKITPTVASFWNIRWQFRENSKKCIIEHNCCNIFLYIHSSCQYVRLNGHSELYCIDDKIVMTCFSYLNRKKWTIIFKILSAFQVKVLNFGGSISKGFLKHQISKEKVLWEVENNNPNSFSTRKSVGEDILIRPFVSGWVSTYESGWVRDSETISFPWRRDTDLYFCPFTFKLHT